MARFYSNENSPSKHFILLHRETPDHKGIVVCTADLDFAGQAGRIHEAVEAHGSLEGKLIRVNRPSCT